MTTSVADGDGPQPAPTMSCPKCLGCGQVTADESEAPWRVFRDLMASRPGAVHGLIRPKTCPVCHGQDVRRTVAKWRGASRNATTDAIVDLMRHAMAARRQVSDAWIVGLWQRLHNGAGALQLPIAVSPAALPWSEAALASPACPREGGDLPPPIPDQVGDRELAT